MANYQKNGSYGTLTQVYPSAKISLSFPILASNGLGYQTFRNGGFLSTNLTGPYQECSGSFNYSKKVFEKRPKEEVLQCCLNMCAAVPGEGGKLCQDSCVIDST